ncbi:unnamed protein product [Pseudo-nitzschia multistriata]|uniref:tRNA-binding domain-containing protein n=1 Tax=Pseudo-nitzschia multistriata TaxID=183589 RepID=A0A448Z307_9STRA|nr:unnamed protein product [Pseudo-nitzschia multistriata]
MSGGSTTMKMLDMAITDLECRLGLKPGQGTGSGKGKQPKAKKNNNKNNNNNNNKDKNKNKNNGPSPEELAAQPEICKLQFKVGVITKVWNHPNADRLYCEEIDVGEETGPRQIASGLRPHFSLEEMMGQRLLVVANLKAKNLVKFKSHGMVLCAASKTDDGIETVEFVEPPEGASPGDTVSFEGLPQPIPLAASQVEKKKVFVNCLEGMVTDGEGIATWNGHRFEVKNSSGETQGYCRAKTICGGAMR